MPISIPKIRRASVHLPTSHQFSSSPLLTKLLGSSLLRQLLAALLPRPNQLKMSRPLAQQRLRLGRHA